MIISMTAGISVAWWVGAATYLVAAVVLMSGARRAVGSDVPECADEACNSILGTIAA
jgi:hypothetical protein